MSASEIIENKLWWNGPAWLSLSEDHWPEQKRPITPNLPRDVEEVKPLFDVTTAVGTSHLRGEGHGKKKEMLDMEVKDNSPFGLKVENFSDLKRLL